MQALYCDQSTPRPESVKMLLQSISLFFSYLLFSSVQSCRTVSEPDVTLTGVCPNDTATLPIGKQLDYECTATFSGSFLLYWNISGVIAHENNNPKPPGIDIVGSATKSTLTITALRNNTVVDIQCGLCNVNCFSNPQKFIGTESVQLITFGKLSIIFDVD